jgi:DNA-directed RNA polymerase subunit F
MAALTDPTGTFVQTAKDCASSVTEVVKSKMTAKQRKKAKYMTRCFSVDPSKLKKTTEAVTQFGNSLLLG